MNADELADLTGTVHRVSTPDGRMGRVDRWWATPTARLVFPNGTSQIVPVDGLTVVSQPEDDEIGTLRYSETQPGAVVHSAARVFVRECKTAAGWEDWRDVTASPDAALTRRFSHDAMRDTTVIGRTTDPDLWVCPLALGRTAPEDIDAESEGA